MIDPFPVNWLAYLLRAGRAYRALILVEPQAVRLERQAAVFQQAAHLRLRVLDQRFIEDPVDPPRQHLLEVCHKLDVVAVIPADIFLAVSEMLAAGEVLLEAGKAAAERVAPGID